MNITIPRGKHYQFSLSRLWHRFMPFFSKTVVFEAQILSEPYDIRPDADQMDRHKLFGVNTRFWKPSNFNSMMVSFQANPESNTWDIAIYVNDNKAWVHRPEIKTKAGDKITGIFTRLDKYTLSVTLWVNGNKVNQTPFRYTWGESIFLPAKILSWHGGKDNDGNGIGGVSPVDLNIILNIYKNLNK